MNSYLHKTFLPASAGPSAPQRDVSQENSFKANRESPLERRRAQEQRDLMQTPIPRRACMEIAILRVLVSTSSRLFLLLLLLQLEERCKP